MAKFRTLGFVTHGFCQKSDSQRETSAKRVAFSEVHKLCVIVFDFFEYSFLLLCQCCRQFLLMADDQLCNYVVLAAALNFIFMRSDIAVVKM